ncbi:glutathione S-transferase family protein [Novosphingobium olei]|uniref:Glutathione S-transferase family protein n=1 Tax=Novosphingobium olei TaxID=2728851 RepID=A0A7Y0GC59_9SPHN|nr:glutathione S-transferase family protein [Novosphingobium olei]NML95709.1 glutathione S-transferase family protein [Novosphingobium olei]
MIFYDFDLFAPNPWIAWIFAQEKGIVLERRFLDLFTRENRREPFVSRVNPLGELPALELGDGTVITEVTPICEYLEDICPDPPLIGSTPQERAQTRMWVRRIDQNIAWPMGEGFTTQEGRALFEGDHQLDGVLAKPLLPPEAAPILKAKSRAKLLWLDRQMQGQPYVCGNRFTLADIVLYCFLQFGENHGQPIPEEAPWSRDFFGRMKARPTTWHEPAPASKG